MESEDGEDIKIEDLKTELREYFKGQGCRFDIKEINLHREVLSPIRNQKEHNVSAFISAASCVEMCCKLLNIKQNNSLEYYFDINEAHDNIYKQFPDPVKDKDVKNICGTEPTEVLKYARDKGFAVTSAISESQDKNTFSKFCMELERQHITSFEELRRDEIYTISTKYPIITSLNIPKSLKLFDQIVFDGSTKGGEKVVHHVVIVGNATVTVNRKDVQYVLVQNCWGVAFGFRGFTFIPVRKHMLVNFFIPIVTTEMNQIVKELRGGEKA